MNHAANLAESFALHTHQSFFLTGKAGTGKTTFLKNLLQKTRKNTIVVAPTGVAAINAGGVTIHSMFGLPLKSFVPSNDYTDPNIALNRNALSKHLRYRKDKQKLIRELELLVIDEISMVRCDILDAIDFALRYTRRSDLPFGGVQLLVIGDLYQLSPIVRDDIRPTLNQYYDSPYFFSAYAWKALHPITIELTTVYRQKDDLFINILNHIRNGVVDDHDLAVLNERYRPGYRPENKEYITLTTHNRIADEINEEELQKLDTPIYKFHAKVEGDFNENAYPVDEELRLREGAVIMFTRNDAEAGKYFNGKLATIVGINNQSIEVEFSDTNEMFRLTKEVWENKAYTLNTETNEIEEEVKGSFVQYPIRLAWAITVHKSQGLTFEKAVLDIGKSFAAGQTYVALSRCTSLEGLVLSSTINPRNVYVDDKIVAFHKEIPPEEELEEVLEIAKKEYAIHSLQGLFDFSKLKIEMNDWQEMIITKKIPEPDQALILSKQLIEKINEVLDVQSKFARQLNGILKHFAKDDNAKKVIDRCAKAVAYYADLIYKGMIQPTHAHIQEMAYKKNVKSYLSQTQEMYDAFWFKLGDMYDAHFMEQAIYKGERYDKAALPIIKTANTAKSNQKGSTYRDTLALFKQGKNIEEIAALRSMSTATIEGHLAKWITQGEVGIYEVMKKERVQEILPYFEATDPITLSGVKTAIPFETTFSELKMILAYYQYAQKVD